jgi:hypothetical protein
MSTPFQKIIIGTMAAAYISYRNFDRAAGVKTYPLPKDQFQTRSLGAKRIKWDFDKPTRSIELLATDENVLALTKEAAARSLAFESGQQGATDYLVGGQYHTYLHVTCTMAVSAMFKPWLADRVSYAPLRALLSMFPPFGGEVPEVPRLGDNPVDEYGIGVLTPDQEDAQYRAMVEYRKDRLKSNIPLSGTIGLGNVFVAASHCKIASNDQFVVRYVMMSTTTLHPLDGRVLWVHVYDKLAGTTMFFAIGAGRNELPFIDRMNNHTAGHVFSTMHSSFAKALNMAEESGGVKRLTDGVADRGLSQELTKGDKVLAARRTMASTFDLFSRMIALMRQMAGMEVVDVPSTTDTTDTTEQDVLSLSVPKELDD